MPITDRKLFMTQVSVPLVYSIFVAFIVLMLTIITCHLYRHYHKHQRARKRRKDKEREKYRELMGFDDSKTYSSSSRYQTLGGKAPIPPTKAAVKLRQEAKQLEKDVDGVNMGPTARDEEERLDLRRQIEDTIIKLQENMSKVERMRTRHGDEVLNPIAARLRSIRRRLERALDTLDEKEEEMKKSSGTKTAQEREAPKRVAPVKSAKSRVSPVRTTKSRVSPVKPPPDDPLSIRSIRSMTAGDTSIRVVTAKLTSSKSLLTVKNVKEISRAPTVISESESDGSSSSDMVG